MPRLTRREVLKGAVVLGVWAALPVQPTFAAQLYWMNLTEAQWGDMTEAEWGAMLEASYPTGTTLTGTGRLGGQSRLGP